MNYSSTRRTTPAPQPAFALIELAAVLVVSLLLAAALLISTSDSRRLARLGQDLTHLRAIGSSTAAYSADSADLFPTFSWRAGQVYQTQYPDLSNAPTDTQAAANQMVYILRTRAGRPDMPSIQAFIPHISYSHLVLADYAAQKFPWTAAISSADTHRQKWASDPACFDQGCFLPNQPDPLSSPLNKRWPYSASFSPTLAFFDQSEPQNRIQNQGSYSLYLVPSGTFLRGVQMTQVRYPSHKVMVHDSNARHFGPRQPYATHDEARLPLLMADGSVPVRAAAESNNGWVPQSPSSPSSLQFTYDPLARPWEPQPITSPGGDFVRGRFRYTRQAILGRDFGGPEIQ